MPILVSEKKGFTQPMIVCAGCGQPIEKAADGNIVWTTRRGEIVGNLAAMNEEFAKFIENRYIPKFYHKLCDRLVDYECSWELDWFVVFLVNSLGIDVAATQKVIKELP